MNNPSLDPLLLTLLSTQTPALTRWDGNRILTFSKDGRFVDVALIGGDTWLSELPYTPPRVEVDLGNGWKASTSSPPVIEAFKDCRARTDPIKQAEIIAALKSLTATP